MAETPPGPFVLVAIDGTYSDTYNVSGNVSSVKKFYQSMVATGGKAYWAGPGANIKGDGFFDGLSRGWQGATGRQLEGIILGAEKWLLGQMAKLENPRIVMVGHSRGGTGCIALARRLKDKKVSVHFMGLYDAVDRTFVLGIDGDTVPDNVKRVVHAKRHKDVGSRTSFGNAASSFEQGVSHAEKSIWGTHGAIGGCIPEETEKGWAWGKTEYTTLSKRQNRNATIQAHEYIRAEAAKVGIQFL